MIVLFFSSSSSCSLLFEVSERSDGGVMAQSDSMIVDAASDAPIDATPILLRHADSGTLSPGIGNQAGGSPFNAVPCSPPAVAVGVRASTYRYLNDGDFLDDTYLCNFQLLCDSVEARDGRAIRTGVIAVMPLLPGLGTCDYAVEVEVEVEVEAQLDLLCPGEAVVVGLNMSQVQENSPIVALTAFTQVKLNCAEVGSAGIVQVVSPASGSIGTISMSGESEILTSDCIVGQVVVGMEGRSGASLDYVALRCDGLTE